MIKALIIMSPISNFVKLSAFTTTSYTDSSIVDLEVQTNPRVEFYEIVNRIMDVQCPIMVIHGSKDEFVPIPKTLELVKLLTCEWSTEWYPVLGTHKYIIKKYRSRFFLKLLNFIKHVKIYQAQYEQEESNDENNTIERKVTNFDNFNLDDFVQDKNEDILTIRKSNSYI